MLSWKVKRARNRRASERPETPRRHLVSRALAGAAVLAALLTALWALNRPIRTVTVTGSFQHVTPSQVERTVAQQVRGAGLLTVSLAGVRRAVARIPWVASVSVQRAWPHGLDVWVEEQVAAARWDEDGLVNASGTLFVTHADAVSPGLAHLSGPDGTQAQVTRRYLAMQQRLAPSGLAIAALSLDARGTWQFSLSDGITVRLGRSQVEGRFDRFMSAALGIVEQRAAQISHVDMRYTNGFAIGWRKGAPHNAIPSEGRHARPASPSGPQRRLAQDAAGALKPRPEGRDA